jgi:hypothetical protein
VRGIITITFQAYEVDATTCCDYASCDILGDDHASILGINTLVVDGKYAALLMIVPLHLLLCLATIGVTIRIHSDSPLWTPLRPGQSHQISLIFGTTDIWPILDIIWATKSF